MLWESSAEENCAMECISCQKSPGGESAKRSAILCDDMAIDELSFYNDDNDYNNDDDDDDDEADVTQLQQATQLRVGTPEYMGLLSPECSPQRFEIVQIETSQQQKQQQHQQAQQQQPQAVIACQQKLEKQQQQQQNSTALAKPACCFRVFNSLSSESSIESTIDDDYMELLEMESFETHNSNAYSAAAFNFPSNLNTLISGRIKHASPAKAPDMRRPSVRRCLSMTTENKQQQQTPSPKQKQQQEQEPKTTETAAKAYNNNNSCCFKRPDPPLSATCSPIQNKRHRCNEKENQCTDINIVSTSPVMVHPTHPGHPPLRKSMSMNDADIMTALARSDNKDEPDLIGDFSKVYVLPIMEGRHRDLKSISSDTVARLLRGEFNDYIASYNIIDCRYPYEYEGGHIRGAKNLYTQEQIMEEFLTHKQRELAQEQKIAAGHKRNIIIFHCEFSSERGPKMSRFLRNIDRARNTNTYPALDYPEIYLLHNGYKEFFETHAELCNPEAYRPMLEPAFNEAYRHFRAKSKSWNGDGATTGRLKKSRSRLML